MIDTPRDGCAAPVPAVNGKDWWGSLSDDFDRRADDSVVSDERITEFVCQTIVGLEHVSDLFADSKAATQRRKIRVLDFGCGQGQHISWFAERYPNISFHGHDSSSYLVGLARTRAVSLSNVSFSEGKATNLPAKDRFDLVMLMGNSFGSKTTSDDTKLLNRVFSLLKPGGYVIMDLPDVASMSSNFKDQAAEWIDGHLAQELLVEHRGSTTSPHSKLLVCRERKINDRRNKLACREVILDTKQGFIRDNAYSIKLYSNGELENILARCGFALHPTASANLDTSDTDGDEDLGTLRHRQLAVAQKPNYSARHMPIDDSVDLFVHPHLDVRYQPEKGRHIVANNRITAGTLLFATKPYAVAPATEPRKGEYFICTNFRCGKKIPKAVTIALSCVCLQEVVWCDDHCRDEDRDRHRPECAWLDRFAKDIRSKHGVYDFDTLWLITRALTRRQVELKTVDATAPDTPPSATVAETSEHTSEFLPNTWDSIVALLENRAKISPEKMAHWVLLVDTYLKGTEAAGSMSTDELIGLMCKEETNSFGMYPRANGIPSYPGGQKDRGIAYGLAWYTRSSFFNHSCVPNVSPDFYFLPQLLLGINRLRCSFLLTHD